MFFGKSISDVDSVSKIRNPNPGFLAFWSHCTVQCLSFSISKIKMVIFVYSIN